MEKLSINSYLKKFFIVFLACFMMISLTGCSSDDSSSSGDSSDTTETANNEITFTELTVVDNDECSIIITGIDEDGFWGYTLTAELENKSEDKTYMFSVESATVNGVMSDPFFASEVAAGKKSNEEISFINDTTLEENGIDEFTDIELTFKVYNSDDWEEDAVANETVHVYPYGEDKATTFTRESQDTDNVLVDNDEVTVIVTGYDPDDTWGYGVNLYLVNKTDTEVMFSVDDASINGYMIDPVYATTVNAGKCAFSTISWYDSDLEDNSIDNIKEIEFKLSAYNNEDWLDDYYVDGQTVTLNP